MELYLEYLRISRTDRLFCDDPLKTLERHEQILSGLREREGYHVTDIFREVVSGDSIAERPKMQQLLKLIETGRYAGVLVMDADRLARGDTIDQGIVSRAFQITGTKIITPSKVYDPLDEFDNDYFEYALFMGRKEYKMIKKRLNRGRMTSAMEGKFVGSTPPYGYEKYKLPQQKGYSLIRNSDSDTVILIFERFNGIGCVRLGIKGIANELNKCGIPSPKGNCWSANTIGSILRNPVYAGYIRYNYKKEERLFQDGEVKKVRRNNEETKVLVKGLQEALIPEELFQSTQSRFGKAPKTPRVKTDCSLKNPLSGIVRCAKCGHSLVRKKSGGKELLICTQYGCDNVGSYSHLIEQELLLFLKEYTKDMTPIEDFVDTNHFKAGGLDRIIDAEQKKLEALKQTYGKLYDLLEQDVYTLEIYLERKEKLDQKAAGINKNLDCLKQQQTDEQQRRDTLSVFHPKAKHPLEFYDRMTMEERNRILKCFIDHADYLKEVRCKKNQGNTPGFVLTVFPKL